MEHQPTLGGGRRVPLRSTTFKEGATNATAAAAAWGGDARGSEAEDGSTGRLPT
jgi:hypothetical protein